MWLTRYTVKPLMTTMNNPKVSKIAGNEKITKTGLMIALMIARKNPAQIMTPKLPLYVMCDPKNAAEIHNPKLQTSQRTKNL